MTLLMPYAVRVEPITLEEYASKLASWRGTRYVDSGCTKGGIDCLRFAVLIMDWLHGWDTDMMPPAPKLPPQTAIHDPKSVFKILDWIRDRYSPNHLSWKKNQPIDEQDLWPGDLIACRNQVHPGHAVVAGPRHNTCWHSLPDISLKHGGNVHETSIGWCNMIGVTLIIRCEHILLERP